MLQRYNCCYRDCRHTDQSMNFKKNDYIYIGLCCQISVNKITFVKETGHLDKEKSKGCKGIGKLISNQRK